MRETTPTRAVNAHPFQDGAGIARKKGEELSAREAQKQQAAQQRELRGGKRESRDTAGYLERGAHMKRL